MSLSCFLAILTYMNIVLPLLLGFAPSLVWLAFFLREDVHPEPRQMIAKAYIWGGVSSLAALVLEVVSHKLLISLPLTLPGIIDDNLSVFLGFSVIEEVIKFFFIYVLVRKSPHLDEPVDAMIYMVTGALGFAAAENLFLMFSSGGQDMVGTIILRFIGATLLHALSSAIVGHHWARGIKFNIEAKLLVAGLVMASLFHTLFNYLVFRFDDIIIYPTAFLMLLGFFVLYDFEELKQMEGEEVSVTVKRLKT